MTGRVIRVLAVALALGGMAWAFAHFGFGRQREWTTRSPEALREFEAGLEATMRFYETDAAARFRRAIELDPDFAAARFQLTHASRDPEEKKRTLESLGAVDLSRLTDRERFLVEMAVAWKDEARQQEIAAKALREQPEDPWVLYVAANMAWEKEEWAEADRLYRSLLEVDPNWVTAHNNLGYLAMSRAEFESAEEHFRTYIYVAPDQANPHDSLAELYALLGRYDEARAEDELALQERPDFCASYINLVGISVLEGDAAAARAVVDRARPHCRVEMIRELECDVRILASYFEKDADRPWREGFADCAGKPGKGGPIFHRLALLSGRADVAEAEREGLRAELESDERRLGYKGWRRRLQIEIDHDEGLRALLAGDTAEAVAKFQAADSRANYWGAADGRFKMFNLHHLALALERANRPEEAARAIAEIAKVNPPFAAAHERVVQDLDLRR